MFDTHSVLRYCNQWLSERVRGAAREPNVVVAADASMASAGGACGAWSCWQIAFPRDRQIDGAAEFGGSHSTARRLKFDFTGYSSAVQIRLRRGEGREQLMVAFRRSVSVDS